MIERTIKGFTKDNLNIKEEKFKVHYQRLNPRQTEAVDTIEGPVMVIAGPGTGKTTILTLRIANILAQTDTPPHGILAITYTDAGVRAMRAKLQEFIGDRAYDVRLHTFHSFASSIINEYPDHFLHRQENKQMTDVEQESLIRQIISLPEFKDLRPSGRPDVFVPGILRAIDESKREAIFPSDVRTFASEEIIRIEKDENYISTRGATKGELKAEAKDLILKCQRTSLFASVYEIYEERKKEQGLMDFNDLIIEILYAFQHDELLLRLIQERYLYIHVDEHQDTNDAQNFIVGLIAQFFETPNIFIVGDEKQAIYRFQGASVENFFLLQRRWPAMKVISLDTNYRSHQSILDASFAMIENNYAQDEHKDLRIKLKAGNKSAVDPIEIVTGENTPAIEEYLIERLKKLKEGETAAIIVRRNRDLDRVIKLLEFHQVPVSSQRSVDIFNHPVGKLFFALLEYLADNSQVEALAKTIVSGMWKLSLDEIVSLNRSIRAGIFSDFGAKLPALQSIEEHLLSEGPMGFIIYAAKASGFADLVASDPVYVHVWRGIVAHSEALVREGRIIDPKALIEVLLAYQQSAESRPVKISVGAPDYPIHAMTAHGSKGLEFDYVFIPYASDSSWVGRPRGASFLLPKKHTLDSDINDIRRLFYVALTRARRHVIILTALSEADGKALSPLRFIEELHSNHVVKKSLPQVGIEKIYSLEEKNKISETDLEEGKIIDLSKKTLIESGLSVTALNHFLKCPNKFLYLSILKMPEAPTVASEKGNALHEGLSTVWKSPTRTKEEISIILKNAFDEYFERSFLSISDKNLAKEELLEKVEIVSSALESHFNIPKDAKVFTEFRLERKLGEIFLHGKLDALIDLGDDILIYDYKSRQSLSIAAIKGETKDSNADYFRQLIFYRILTERHSNWKGRKISPALVFVSPDDKGRCPTIALEITDNDINGVMTEIDTLIDSVWSGKIAKEKCTDEKCNWCGLRNITLS